MTSEGAADPGAAGATVAVFPEFATAALRAGLERQLAAWLAIRAVDPRGSGLVLRADAIASVAALRGVSSSQARKMLADPCGFWVVVDGSVAHRSVRRVADLLAVERVSRARLVPWQDLGGSVAMLRGALMATVLKTDAAGWPISRTTLAILTGRDARTVRRWDRLGGHTTVTEEIRVEMPHLRSLGAEPLTALARHGFYQAGDGRVFRRLPDARRATRHTLGSRRLAGRLNRDLRGSRLSVSAREEQEPRRSLYFDSPAAFLQAQRTGRVAHFERADDLLDFATHYAALLAGTNRVTGARKWVAEPLQHYDGSGGR